MKCAARRAGPIGTAGAAEMRIEDGALAPRRDPGRFLVEQAEVVEDGPVRTRIGLKGRLGKGPRLWFSGNLSLFHGGRLGRLELTVENPSRARHSGGYWDLGDPGSVLLRGLSLELTIGLGSDWSPTGSKNLLGELKVAWLHSQHALDGLRGTESLIELGAVDGIFELDLRVSRTLAGFHRLRLDRDPQRPFVLDHIAGTNLIAIDFHGMP